MLIRRQRRAFTLVELLVVISIIGTLIGLLLPALSAAKEAARKMECSNNIKNIVLALTVHATNHSAYPPGVPSCSSYATQWKISPTETFCQGPNWASAILSDLEEKNAYESLGACMEASAHACADCSKNDPSGNNLWLAVGTSTPKAYRCPSAEQIDDSGRFTGKGFENLAKGNYAACTGKGVMRETTATPPGPFGIVTLARYTATSKSDPKAKGRWKFGSKAGVKPEDIKDGQTKTMLISEVQSLNDSTDARGVWTLPIQGASFYSAFTEPNAVGVDLASKDSMMSGFCKTDLPNKHPLYTPGTAGENSYAGARSSHVAGVNVGFADGSVHYIGDSIDKTVWQAYATIDGGRSEGTVQAPE